jgi:ParB family chromosome partitioning protein
MKSKIDLSSLKRIPKGNDTQFNENTPQGLVDSYTSTWGSTTEKVEEIPLTSLKFFELNGSKQPFNINQDKIEQIKLSAKDIGIITPLIVRKVNDSYQIVSGHHRFLVAKELGLLSVPCIVRSIPDDVVYKYVTESNIQRLRVYPSEYGQIFLRYMELRQDIDMTAQEIAKKFGLSKKTMYRYINVTKLIESLQKFVDCGLISLDAVDIICQFSKENQEVVCEYLNFSHKKVMVSLAKRVAQAVDDGNAITKEMVIHLAEDTSKKKYKNRVYNILAESYDLNCSEKELDELVLKLLQEHFAKN